MAIKKKYVDASAIADAIRKRAGYPLNRAYEQGYHVGMLEAAAMLESASAEDVAPVRHGTWNQPGTDGAEESLWCSVCGAGPHLYPWRHCPDCGARMDGQAAQ